MGKEFAARVIQQQGVNISLPYLPVCDVLDVDLDEALSDDVIYRLGSFKCRCFAFGLDSSQRTQT